MIEILVGQDRRIFLLIVLLTIYLLAIRREMAAIQIGIFSIPLTASPTYGLGVAGVVIWLTVIFRLVRLAAAPSHHSYSQIQRRGLTTALLSIATITLIGIGLALVRETYRLDWYTGEPWSVQLAAVTVHLVTTAGFVWLMASYGSDYEKQTRLLIAFCVSILLQGVVISVDYLGLTPGFLTSLVERRDLISDETSAMASVRYAGLVKDYELACDYSMVVIGFSIIAGARKHWAVMIPCIVVASACALLSGTRSFLVIVAMFGFLWISVGLIAQTLTWRGVAIATAASIVALAVVFVATDWLADLPMFLRLEQTVSALSDGDYARAMNREYLPAIETLWNEVGPFGGGALFLYSIREDAMPAHNLLLGTHAKFGLVGVVMVVYLFARSSVALLTVAMRSTQRQHRFEATVLLALLLPLFVQQMKVSALRYLSTMLIYALLFSVIRWCLVRPEQSRSRYRVPRWIPSSQRARR